MALPESFKQVSNPLTVIAIFAGLAEIAMTIALTYISPDLQRIFIWFIMGFPTLLVLLFFATLNWNYRVLYAPSDFRNDEGWLATLNSRLESKDLQNISAGVANAEEIVKELQRDTHGRVADGKLDARLHDAELELEKIQDQVRRSQKQLLHRYHPRILSLVARWSSLQPNYDMPFKELLREFPEMTPDELALALEDLVEHGRLELIGTGSSPTTESFVKIKG